MRRSCLLAFLSYLLSNGSIAGVATVQVYINYGYSTAVENGSDSVEIFKGLTTSDSSASAEAYSNLVTGTFRADAVAPPIPQSPDAAAYFSSARAQVFDFVYFSPGATGTAYLDYHWSGTLSSSYYYGGAGLIFHISHGLEDNRVINSLSTSHCAADDPTCTIGTKVDQIGSIPFQITTGLTLIDVTLFDAPGDGDMLNAANQGSFVASIFLRTPAGITFGTNSGNFLIAANPILSAVPEPAASALLTIGLAAVGLRLSLRRRVLGVGVELIPGRYRHTS